MKYENITEGRFLDRPNRFIAHVEIAGQVETVHVKNTGRCRELLVPGAQIFLDPGPYLVIGDRRQDLECARSCKSPFIGCLYGYGEKGELDGADYFVKSVEEITGII